MRVDREINEKCLEESVSSFEARKLWYSFKDAIFYENRFFVKHQLLDMLSEYMASNILTIESGKVYYRARIIDDNCINDHMIYKCYAAPEGEKLDIKYVGKANPFKGLTKEASFVPPKEVKVSAGRANPKYVKYYCQSSGYKGWINSFNTGSTRGNINAQTLGRMPIPVLERKQQDNLVSILSSIDEKIKKNNQINNNLAA